MNRTIAAIALLIPLAAPACDSPTAPDAASDHELAAGWFPTSTILSANVRGIIDPEIHPSSAYGTIQLRLTDRGDGTYRADWYGRFSNPAMERFTAGHIGIDPDIMPTSSSPGAAVARLFGGASLRCDVAVDSRGLYDTQIIPATVARAMLRYPERYEARLTSSTLTGGAVAGRLALATNLSFPATIVSGGVGCY
jgi:hypothetical protein